MKQIWYSNPNTTTTETTHYANSFGQNYELANHTSVRSIFHKDVLYVIYRVDPTIIRILVMTSSYGFQLWPRDGEIQTFTIQGNDIDYTLPVTKFGGYHKAPELWSIIYGQSPYPLNYSEITGTFFVAPITQLNTNTIATDCTAQYSGSLMTNEYWISSTGLILNWCGVANRHFRSTPDISIEGYTNVYTGANGTSIIHTPFTNNIYSNGVIVYTLSQADLVIGAFTYKNNLYAIVCNTGEESLLKYTYNEITQDYFWNKKYTRNIGYHPTSSCFIADDGSKYVSYDGATIDVDTLTITNLELHVNGNKQARITNSKLVGVSCTETGKQLWHELDDFVTITTTASWSTTTSGNSTKTTTQIPVRALEATGISVALFNDSSVYTEISGETVPEGASVFVAVASVHGSFCTIEWSTEGVNGCSNSVSGDAVSNDQLTYVGLVIPQCEGTNFFVKAKLESGVVGKSAAYSQLNCNSNPPLKITQNGNVFRYSGNITLATDSSVSWSVRGADIVGSSIEPSVTLTNMCNGSVTVVGSCGSITQSFTGQSSLTITGVQNPEVGNGYSANGVSPITWSISGTNWEINRTTGVITQKGCGTGTITATDFCEVSGTKSVTAAGGVWVAGESCITSLCTCGATGPFSYFEEVGETDVRGLPFSQLWLYGSSYIGESTACCQTNPPECEYCGTPRTRSAAAFWSSQGCEGSRSVVAYGYQLYNYVCP